MLNAKIHKHDLIFKEQAGTSRGTLAKKVSIFLGLYQDNKLIGLGECSLLPGLSFESEKVALKQLNAIAKEINKKQVLPNSKKLEGYPCVRFCVETAILGFNNVSFDKVFVLEIASKNNPIKINGLVWMDSQARQLKKIEKKIAQGFQCIKLKVGALSFEEDLALIKEIREVSKKIEIRLDANGSFNKDNVYKILDSFSKYNIHSIEQPLKAGQVNETHELIKENIIDIALDEEIIFHKKFYSSKEDLLEKLNPQYIILKPGLIGGFSETSQWISLSKDKKIGFWLTSALESNVGLHAIYQYCLSLQLSGYQGLGTGSLFENNIESPLVQQGENILIDNNKVWNLSMLFTK